MCKPCAYNSIQYMEMDLGYKTFSEFRTGFQSPLGVPTCNPQLPLVVHVVKCHRYSETLLCKRFRIKTISEIPRFPVAPKVQMQRLVVPEIRPYNNNKARLFITGSLFNSETVIISFAVYW